MAKQTTTQLFDALEEAALAGAKEIKEFLGTYRGNDPDRLKRVQVAVGAVSGYTRWRASQNNMVSMMLMAARQTGLGQEQTLQIAYAAGLLPPGLLPREIMLESKSPSKSASKGER